MTEVCWHCGEPVEGCGISGWLHVLGPDDDYDHEAHPPGKGSLDLNDVVWPTRSVRL